MKYRYNNSVYFCGFCVKEKYNLKRKDMEINEITYLIRGAIFEVHKNLGPGLLESVYEKALLLELKEKGLYVTRQEEIPVYYKGKILDEVGFRADLIVENQVLIELKSVRKLKKFDFKKTLNYLKLTKMKLGILVNFNVEFIEDKKSLFRIIN